MSPTILLWTPEEDHEELLAYNLVKEGFIVSSVNDESEIVSQAFSLRPDLIVMGDCSTDEFFIKTADTIKAHDPAWSPKFICLTTKNVVDYSHPVCKVTDLCLSLPSKPKTIMASVMGLLNNDEMANQDC